MHTSRWLPIWLVVRQKVLRKIGLRPLSHQTEPICFSLSELRNWLDHTTMRPTTMSQAFEERHSESAAQARRIFFGLGSPEHASGGVNTMKHRIGTSKEVISLLIIIISIIIISIIIISIIIISIIIISIIIISIIIISIIIISIIIISIIIISSISSCC